MPPSQVPVFIMTFQLEPSSLCKSQPSLSTLLLSSESQPCRGGVARRKSPSLRPSLTYCLLFFSLEVVVVIAFSPATLKPFLPPPSLPLFCFPFPFPLPSPSRRPDPEEAAAAAAAEFSVKVFRFSHPLPSPPIH